VKVGDIVKMSPRTYPHHEKRLGIVLDRAPYNWIVVRWLDGAETGEAVQDCYLEIVSESP